MKNSFIFVISIIILCLIPTTVFAQGDNNEENTQSEQSVSVNDSSEFSTVVSEEASQAHEHDYKIIKFNVESGVGVIRCSVCGDEYNDVFVHHLYSEYHQSFMLSDQPWDVVPDETINGQDYAWLMHEFSSDYSYLHDFFSVHEFLYKEQFFYIYLTSLFLISTGCICLSYRRFKK